MLLVALVMLLWAGPAWASGSDANVEWWFESSTRKVFPDNVKGTAKTGRLTAARNEYESVQLILRSRADVSGVKIAYVGSGARPIPAKWVRLFETLYVKTPGVTEWGFPAEYPEARRPAYPDPLVPLIGGNRDGAVNLKGGEARPIWVRIHVPADAAPGQYSGKLTVTLGSRRISAPIKLEVWPFTLPRATTLKTGIGLTARDIAKFHGVEQNSDRCRALEKTYYDELLEHRICAYYIPYNLTDPRAKAYIHDERVNTFIAPMNKSTWEYLKSEDVLHKAWLYNVDEPESKEVYTVIKDQAAHVRKEMPGLRYGAPFFVGPKWDKALTPMDELTGYMNLWICQTDYYFDGHGQGDKVKNQMRERFEAGDETWWYVACAPREPFCNFLINMLALQHRILFWQVYADPIITGLLYWRATHWWEVEDPYEDMATCKGIDKHMWGDGSLFYPGAKFGIDGPVTSVRLECMRDGLEDHEYLALAERKFGRKRVMELVGDVTESLTKYTRDPAKFEAVRMRLGKALAAGKLDESPANSSNR